jgi:hypothetical protein
LEEKSAKKLDIWKGGYLSIAGRTNLINSSLSNTSIYHMSMYLLPKTVIKNMDKSRRMFFWQGGSVKKKIIWLDGKIFANLKGREAWE